MMHRSTGEVVRTGSAHEPTTSHYPKVAPDQETDQVRLEFTATDDSHTMPTMHEAQIPLSSRESTGNENLPGKNRDECPPG